MVFYSESQNLVSALILRVRGPVLGDSNDPGEKCENHGKVVIPSAIIRRKQALPGGG